ncbi:unnamed protein product [Strongylus vulgaris]|uniref:Major facilitator superfamily (MFS) profile domain-containing protein n=1 Tax=Strongylus vulgaris TaxID=40348 RepID=A0A3P7KHS4_STRVU|nr:unnamed protein product [Strongylus vulgaris]
MAFYYFGLSFLSVDLSEDRFTAFLLSTFAELPGGFAVIPLMLYAGRRILCVTTMAAQGLAIIVAPFSRVEAGIQNSGFSVTYDVHPLYVAEMAPTSVRSLFYSLINVPQSIGIIVAPYLRHVELGAEYTKYVIIGLLCIISGVLCLFLPETKDRPLPADIRAISRKTKVDLKENEELMTLRTRQSDEETPRIFED